VIFTLRAKPSALRTVAGNCATCALVVYEAVEVLDDAFGVYVGRCPHCQALNYLSTQEGRGYDGQRMHLVLPQPTEAA
jgi:hypothetical protein